MKNERFTNVYQLKSAYEDANPRGHYFDEDTLKFFGERLSDMSVLKSMRRITDSCGEKHDCYVLSKVSHNFFGKKVRTYGYFDKDTLKDIAVNEY